MQLIFKILQSSLSWGKMLQDKTIHAPRTIIIAFTQNEIRDKFPVGEKSEKTENTQNVITTLYHLMTQTSKTLFTT
jgi:hypothetical protein